ncbi:putative transcription factor interactor and regulator CCHC(Zn) family [Rosa chinensis]|uniref:Putative transcription factor interactor and regulator CCHC(Zn) family n=1 Tax=Rosa chinensis TaxID=74649 RepID=A0A2P6SB37_ROSCH|nr:uncharacterized protein LOC112178752 isoform X2 [Rosa chinensis]PRQ55874.1 putative transcription factor interactor and regulator CCHC(Zn) family [Rosa chinensis]
MVKGKKDTRTGGATSSTTGLPHDEEVAKLFQALLRMASLELEGTNGFNRRLKFLKMFISLSPPEYAGNLDYSLEGLEWLRRVKQCFDVLDVPGDLRVGFAVYTLTGAASYWWDFVKRTCDVESMNWDDFEQIFLNRYFPETIRLAKVEEFLNLTQGEMTVSQYDSKFIELSWHAPNLLTSDKDRAGKFLRGLRPSIGMSIPSFMYNTYHEAVAAALKVEQIEIIEYQCVQESFEGASGRGGKRQRYTCHNCGEPGHIRPHCPYNPSSSSL